ncbi:MAG: SusD/RagB family nutrient-binding outer membrane lipoprotein [Bacteroidota bacterium]
MKKIYSLLLILSVLLSSCEEWIDPTINEDPDNPKEVSMGVLLPAIEGSFAYYYGGIDVVGIQCVWMQQFTGSDRQFVAINNYNIRQSDPNNLWNSMYNGVMMDLVQYIEKAENPESLERNAAGVGKVLMAMSLALVTDVWGDVPYSEAFQGSINTTPAFDTQESLYTEIDNLLTEAIADLQSDENVAGITNDYIYDGNPAMWIKAAHTLRARYAMRLTKVQSVDFDAVIADLNNGILDNAEDMEQPFDDASSAGYNPLYQFIEQRSGYLSNNPTYDSMLVDDPRQGIQEWSASGFWTSQGAPVHFTGYGEAMFLLAEAVYRNGDEAAARDTLVTALTASLNKYGVMDADFVAAFETEIASLSGDDLLERIIVEKYKHMLAHPEPYNDWRRTGYPELTPTQGTSIPRRYPYAQDEVNYNPENVPEVNVFQRVWWDAQ